MQISFSLGAAVAITRPRANPANPAPSRPAAAVTWTAAAPTARPAPANALTSSCKGCTTPNSQSRAARVRAWWRCGCGATWSHWKSTGASQSPAHPQGSSTTCWPTATASASPACSTRSCAGAAPVNQTRPWAMRNTPDSRGLSDYARPGARRQHPAAARRCTEGCAQGCSGGTRGQAGMVGS